MLEAIIFGLARYVIQHIDVTTLEPGTRQAVETLRGLLRFLGY